MALYKKEVKAADKKQRIVAVLLILAIVLSVLSVIISYSASQINLFSFSSTKKAESNSAGQISFIVEANNIEEAAGG